MAHARLFPILVLCFVCGVSLGEKWPQPGLWIPLSIGALALATALRGRGKTDGARWVLAGVLFTALGGWNAVRIGQGAAPFSNSWQTVEPQWWDLEGILSEAPQLRHDGTRLVLELDRVDGAVERGQAQGKVLLTVREGGERFRYGDRVRLKCKLQFPPAKLNPGQNEWARRLRLRGVGLQGFVPDADQVLLLARGRGAWPRQWIEFIRWRLTRVIAREFPSPSREVLLALVVGQSGALDPMVRDTFDRLGLSHLMAISGLHFGLVALLVYASLKKILSRFQRLVLRLPLEKITCAVAIPVLSAYAGIAGMGPSVQRALIMALTLAVAILLDRVRRLYHCLALAAMVILLLDPRALFELSFQLSFLAVMGILYAVPRLMSLIPRNDPLDSLSRPIFVSTWRRRVLLAILTTLAATLATMPLSLASFHLMPFMAVPANLVGVPIVGWLVLPMALAGGFLYLLWEPLGMSLLWVAAWMADGAVQVFSWAASVAGGLYLPTPRPWEVAIFYGMFVGALQVRRSPWTRWLVLGLILLQISLWVGEWASRAWGKRLSVHFIAVGNGSSVLIEAPGGFTFLVDGGGGPKASSEVGSALVAPVLWHRRIMGLDRVILTHPHPDHWKGLLFILKAFGPREGVWDNGDRPRWGEYTQFLAAMADARQQLRSLCEGATWAMGGLTLEVLHPPCGRTSPVGSGAAARANNRSLVLKITMGEASFLLPGDIEADQEIRLAQRGGLSSTVLLAPHHGSATSSTEAFLREVAPRFAVFSSRAGAGGLAHPAVRQRYSDLGIETFHTGEDGMVSFVTDGRELSVQTYLTQRRKKVLLDRSP